MWFGGKRNTQSKQEISTDSNHEDSLTVPLSLGNLSVKRPGYGSARSMWYCFSFR
jgi:hypothetical protein